ncbi:MAG: peptidoglycan-binding protein, partial [Rhodospirillales bacterium]|nr:peptidoglycan-binding protein [Rhodospirillales bacterium]
ARLVPPQLAFWSQPEVKDVKNTAPAGMTPPSAPSGAAPGATPNGAPGVASNEPLPGGNTTAGDAKEVGAAKFGGPIKSDTKAPAYSGSSATPTDLAAATRGMKPVDVPEETKSEPKSAPKTETKADVPKAPAKSETKSASVTPAPAKSEAKAAPTPAPKAETKSAAVTPAPKAEAPKAAAPKAAPPEDFLSMVNKAITTGTAPQPSPARSDAEQIEQVSAANDLVQSVQMKLRERGYDPGSIDGRTNPKTVQAIRDYQQSVGMPADGLIDVALMERLGVVGKRLQFPTGR